MEEESRTFQLKIENLSNFYGGLISSEVTLIKSLPWKIEACRKLVGENDEDYFGVFVKCNAETDSKTWRCRADVEIKLLSNGHEAFTKSESKEFSANSSTLWHKKFLLWSQLMNPSAGFVTDDSLTLEVTVKANEPTGGVWDSMDKGRMPFLGIKDQILNLSADRQSGSRLARSACLEKAFRFQSPIRGRNASSIFNFQNFHKLKVSIFRETKQATQSTVFFSLDNIGKSTNSEYFRFIDGEIMLMKKDEEGVTKESSTFKVSGTLKHSQAVFTGELCSLKDFSPFFYPDGVTIKLTLAMNYIPTGRKYRPLMKNFTSQNQKEFGSFLLGNAGSSDLTLECEDKIIPCHKAILASKSPVFQTMFGSGMIEATEGVLKIEDMTAEALEVFLKLIYAVDIKQNEISAEMAFEVLKASEKYEIGSIRDLTIRILVEDDNKFGIRLLVEIFGFCRASGIQELVDKVLRILKPQEDFVKTEEFRVILIEHTEVAQDLLSLLIKQAK